MEKTNDQQSPILNPETQTPVQQAPTPGSSQWIMQILNRIETRLDTIEQRLGKVERLANIIIGVMITLAVVWTLFQFVFSNFDITLTPKSSLPSNQSLSNPVK